MSFGYKFNKVNADNIVSLGAATAQPDPKGNCILCCVPCPLVCEETIDFIHKPSLLFCIFLDTTVRS